MARKINELGGGMGAAQGSVITMKTIRSLTVSLLALAAAFAVPASASAQESSICAGPAKPGGATKVTIDSAQKIGAVGDTIKLRATLKGPNGAGVNDAKVTFRVGNSTAGVAATNSSGVAELAFKVPNQIEKLPLEARFAPTSSCAGASDSSILTIVKSTTELKPLYAEAIVNEKGKLSFSGELKRTTDRTAVGGRAVEIVIDDKVVGTTTTEMNGRFAFTGNAPSGTTSKSKLEARFEGDALYAPTTASSPLVVWAPSVNVRFKTADIVIAPGQTVMVDTSVRSLDPVTKGVAGAKVWFKLNRQIGQSTSSEDLGDGVTDSNGNAKIAVTLDDRDLEIWQAQGRQLEIATYKDGVKVLSRDIGSFKIVPASTSLSCFGAAAGGGAAGDGDTAGSAGASVVSIVSKVGSSMQATAVAANATTANRR